MTKAQIIKIAKASGYLQDHWTSKNLNKFETEDKISLYYIHGDMGLVDKIIYNKINKTIEIYNLNNYYGTTDLVHTIQL